MAIEGNNVLVKDLTGRKEDHREWKCGIHTTHEFQTFVTKNNYRRQDIYLSLSISFNLQKIRVVSIIFKMKNIYCN